MAIDFLAAVLVGPVVKQIAKLAFGEGLANDIAKAGFDWAAKALGKYQADRAELSVDAIAEQTVEALRPLFERSGLTTDEQENVATALGRTLEDADVADLILEHRMDPRQVADALEASRTEAKVELDPKPYGLYQLALGGLAQAFCRIGSQLPRFNEHAAKKTLDALDQLAARIAEALSGIDWIRRRLEEGEREKVEAANENERLYRLALRREVAKLRLFGLDFDKGKEKPEELELDIAYIPLQITLGELGYGRPAPMSLGFPEVLDLLPLFRNRLLIEGLGGSGKSTLMQWTALKALDIHSGAAPQVSDRAATWAKVTAWIEGLPEAERGALASGAFASGDPAELEIGSPLMSSVVSMIRSAGRIFKIATGALWCNRTPFLVRLRDFADGQLPKPEALPGLVAAEAPGDAKAWVNEAMREGRALILLDGIDEVPGEKREKLADSIRNYLDFFEANGCQVIATSRPAAVQDPVWRDLFGPTRVAVREMTPADVEQFIEHWHRAMSKANQEPLDTDKLDALIGKIRDLPALTPLAETPLLCAAICYLHRIRGGDIPDKAENLYAQLCDQLVHRLDELRVHEFDEQQLKQDGLDRLVPALKGLASYEKLDLLARLAEFMVRERTLVLDIDRAARQIEAGLREIGKLDGRDPRSVLDALQERSGVLRGWSQDEVEFAHNRLRSFLAARAFKADEAVRQPIDAAQANADPDLPVLAAAMGSIPYRERLIDMILADAANAEDPRPVQIMALRGAATSPLSDACRGRLDPIEAAVLPPRDPVEAAQLSELGARIAPSLAFVSDRYPEVDAACVRTLRLIGGEEAASTLDGYLATTEERVLDELAQAMNPLRIPEVLRNATTNERFWMHNPLRHLREDDLDLLQSPESIRRLNLRGANLSDAGCLRRFTGLEELHLNETHVRDPAPLGSLTALKYLFLSGTQVSDLAPLGSLSVLESLSLDGTQVSDLAPLGSLTALKYLFLSGTQVSILAPFGSLSALEFLDLNGTQVRDLAPLKNLSALQSLNLLGTQVSDLAPLANLTALQRLYLSGTQVSDLVPLKNLGKLEYPRP